MGTTSIEYLDYSWNPIAMRCTPIFEGCANCWHLRMADRLKENQYSFGHKIREAYAGEGPPVLVESRLNDPMKVKKPSVIGVQFMGDLFLDGITIKMIQLIFNMMKVCQRHTFVLLTKRPWNMKYWFGLLTFDWPIENLWIGVSVSTQVDADNLIPILLQIPDVMQFVSVEPMLGPVDLKQYLSLDWIIIGCESGPKRRPCKLEWIEDLVKQCIYAKIPIFVKQTEINGKVVSMPKIMGRVWDQFPEYNRGE